MQLQCRESTRQSLYCFWIVNKNTEIIEYLRAATFKVDSFLGVKQEPLFHRRPCRWLCSSCGRWLLQNKHCCPSLIHVSEQTNSLVNHTFLSGFRGWAANQTLAQKQAHKPRVKMNRVCGGFTTKAPPWVEGTKLLNVKQRQEGFDLHQSRCSVTRRKKTGNHKPACRIESRRAGGKVTPSHRFWLFARCDGARNSVTHRHFELRVVCRFRLHINIPSGCRSLLLCVFVFLNLVLSFLFCIDLLSGNTQRIKYASGLDGCLYHYFQNKSPNPKKNTIELKFRNNKSKQVDRSISRV